MNDFLTSFDEVFDDLLGWDRRYYAFNRPILDQHPYYELHNEEDKDTLIFNAIGMGKSDISVQVVKEGQTNYLTINGERKSELIKEPYNLRARFSIDMSKIANIKWKVENGLLCISLFHKKPEKSDIKIEYED